MKRFTCTDKWADPWFMALTASHKLAWLYIVDSCDCCGVWKRNDTLANVQIGSQVNWEDALKAFGTRVRKLDKDKWLITPFVRFQYGELKETCKPHQRIIARLSEHGLTLSKGYVKGIDTLEEEVQDKDKDKEKDQDRKTGHLPANVQEAIDWASFGGVPPDFAREVYLQLDGKGWVDGAGQPVSVWRSYVQGRWVKQQHEWLAKRKKENPLAAKLGTESGNHVAKLCRDSPSEPKPDLSKIKPNSPEVEAMLKVASQ